MDLKLRIRNKRAALIYALAFILPFVCMLIVYALFKVFPFGNNTVLVMDMDDQYAEFFSYYHRVLTGQDSLVYSFTKEMGGNVFGLFTYYLSSPFSFLMLFFPQKATPVGIALMTLLKIGASGFTFAVFLRHVFKKTDLSVVLFSCCYALMSYSMFYSMCVMWLDAVIWLPIVLLGIERVLCGKSPLVFILAFTLTLFSNYYTAYMTALFSVIYYIYRYIARNGKKDLKDFSRKTLILVGSGMVCLLLSCVILLPTFLNMLGGKLSSSSYVAPGFWNKNIFEIPRRLFMGQYDSITNSGSPAIFCGMLCGIMAGVYFLSPKIKIRAKIAALCVFAILLVSFFIKEIDMAWHVFQYPNWFPYRYAYVFCFFAIYIAYTGFVKLRETSKVWVIAGVIVYAALLVAVWLFDKEVIKNTKWAILSLILAAVYIAGILAVCFGKKKYMPYVCGVMIVLTCAELTINGFATMQGIDRQFGYTTYSEYSEAVDGIRETADYIKNMDDGFYRAEKTFLRSDNDGMSFGLKGMTHYSSTYNKNVNTFTYRMGMRQEYICSRYHGSTMLTDSLLGVKYIISKEKINDSYELLYKGSKNLVYRNPYALEIGYAVNESVTSELPNTGKALENENRFAFPLLGNWVFNNISKPTTTDGGKALEFTAWTSGMYYVDFDHNYDGVPTLTVNGTNRPYEYDTAIGKKVFYLGKFNSGDQVKIGFTDAELSKNASVAMIDMSALENSARNVRENRSFKVTDYGHTWLEGDITLGSGQVLFITIPYEKGWTAYVDGKKTEPIIAQSTFMAVHAEEGAHHVKLKYRAPGLGISLTISLITLGVLLAVVYRKELMNLINNVR